MDVLHSLARSLAHCTYLLLLLVDEFPLQALAVHSVVVPAAAIEERRVEEPEGVVSLFMLSK